MKMKLSEYRREFKQEIREFGDPLDEPDLSTLGKTFNDYLSDSQRLRDKIKVKRATDKHYREMNPREKELSILTWAEKENVRYLHETEPEVWTPERLAECYPISANGVRRLVRGSMRLRTVKEVRKHDEEIVRRLRELREGKMEVTEEMERRLKIRGMVEVRVGELGRNREQILDTDVPEELGEFGRLVGGKKKEGEGMEGKRVWKECYGEGEMVEELEGKEKVVELSREQLAKIMPVRKVMTFGEFEKRMEKSGGGKMAKDLEYMLEGIEKGRGEGEGVKVEEILEGLEKERGMDGKKVEKYRREGEHGGVVEVRLEGGRAYLWEQKTGYQVKKIFLGILAFKIGYGD